MTNIQRMLIGTVILVGVTVLVLVHYSDDNLKLAVGIYSLILGYAFGTSNGEKALAKEIIKAQANAYNPGAPVSPNSYNAASQPFKVAPQATDEGKEQ